jgi:hypothetical protein
MRNPPNFTREELFSPRPFDFLDEKEKMQRALRGYLCLFLLGLGMGLQATAHVALGSSPVWTILPGMTLAFIACLCRHFIISELKENYQ